ncbi:hypothetical protein [Methanogenium cariaci]|uniref:hypothetical protein n=1 Tax=Methanogenium cariaci TaxID=2197 RepID=UPI0007830659|nr:hypothetical protein [Methanogenium cariaci]
MSGHIYPLSIIHIRNSSPLNPEQTLKKNPVSAMMRTYITLFSLLTGRIPPTIMDSACSGGENGSNNACHDM